MSYRKLWSAVDVRSLLGLGFGLLLAGVALATPVPYPPAGPSSSNGFVGGYYDIWQFRSGYRAKKPKQRAGDGGGSAPCQAASAASTSAEGKGGHRLRSKFVFGFRRGHNSSINSPNSSSGGATGSSDCAGSGSTSGNPPTNGSAPDDRNPSPEDTTPPDDDAAPGSDESSESGSEPSGPSGAEDGNDEESDLPDDGTFGQDALDSLTGPPNGGNEGESGIELELPGPRDFGGDPSLGLLGDGPPDSSGPIFDVLTTNGATPESVPEPGSLALIGLGLAGLGFSRRRRLD